MRLTKVSLIDLEMNKKMEFKACAALKILIYPQ